ncbi:MAG: methyl-accepting chemotaxis protein [Gammaproteobacteria bacterium]|nr:methyl-accepting chemotaxis protein [Gammaproteobacteria bacterium]
MKIWFVLGCLVAGSSIGIINYLLVKLVLLKRLRRISDVAIEIAAKDLRHECTIQSNDIIGDIVHSFNAMVKTMRDMIQQIRAGIQQLDSAAGRMQSMSTETKQDVGHQHSELEQLAQSIVYLRNTVANVVGSAEEASEAANQAENKTHEGKTVMEATRSSIQTLADEVNRAGSSIDTLQEDSKSIVTVLDVITDIAEQTNLLALNAAIEAARAGEQGRGFAVVADEVRVLASRTQESTQEIQSIIKRLQGSTLAAVSVMSEGVEQAKHSVDQFSRAGETLQDITTAVSAISNMNGQIVMNASSQEDIVGEINRTVQVLGQLTDKTAHSAEDAARSSDTINNFTRQLKHLLSEFKLEGETAN